jgi:CDGSH-type Zn-finger protein
MATFISPLILFGFLAAIVGFIGKFIYDFQQNKKQTPSEDGFEFKDDFQKLAGIKPYSTASLNVPTNVTTKKLNEQIVDALLKAAENSEFPKPDESINVQTTKIGTIDTNFGDSDPLATIPMSRVSVEGKKKMAEIAKEDINVQIEKNVEKFATLTNQTKCGCGRSETGFCTGLHRIPKKAWADGVRDIPAEKPKRKYTKKPKA